MSAPKTSEHTLQLTRRQLCDLELLLDGAFAPLHSFMTQAQYHSVVEKMCLPNGEISPIPIVLDVPEKFAAALSVGDHITLRNQLGDALAELNVAEWWQADRHAEARSVYGTSDEHHPGVAYLMRHTQPVYVSGELRRVPGVHYRSFPDLHHSPQQTRELLRQMGWQHTLAFQTRNPIHRGHFEAISAAAKQHNAGILLHPVVGDSMPGDIDAYTRVRCCREVLKHLPPARAVLAVLPLAMRMAGPREALWHACIRKNYGATHLLVGRDHAGPGRDPTGEPYYPAFAAFELAQQFAGRVGITIVPAGEMVYVPARKHFVERSTLNTSERYSSLSGTELRALLSRGDTVPEWFTFPEVARILERSATPVSTPPFTILLTGLSAAGKSTIANALAERLQELGQPEPILFDGDEVRRRFSAGLGFSRQDRIENLRRVALAAAEANSQKHSAICALVSPYQEGRALARQLIDPHGTFMLIHVTTPLAVCEGRDPKGLYRRARKGEVQHFTGVSDPYEEPTDADLCIDTSQESIEESLRRVEKWLRSKKLLTEPIAEVWK